MKRAKSTSSTISSGETSGSGMIRLDHELTVVSLDERAGSFLEVAPEAILGKRLDQFADLANLCTLMKSGISFTNQVIVVGTRRLSCDYVPIAEPDGITGGVLTVRQRLPRPGTDSSDDLKELLRSASDFMNLDYDGIVIVDAKAHVVMVNDAFSEILGTTAQAMIGKHVYQAYPNSQPSHLPEVLETGRPQIGIAHYLNGKQVYASLYPLVKNGKVIGGLGKILFKDIRELTLLANRVGVSAEARQQARTFSGKGSQSRYDLANIVGQSAKILALKESVLRVAQKKSNVLLRGESGTGKELFAHAIHAASSRRYEQFVQVNCAAIPEHLLESELFGYAEGAFTGAKKGGQIGKFEQANNGTIFLDEIGDMPLYMQAKMLRVLQEGELAPLGSATPKMIDVRVVAATNSDLEQLIAEGKFREDLYYRLKVVTLVIPPLRERMEDLPALVQSFVHQFNEEFGLEVHGLDGEAWEVIRRYTWPGNIRELRNVIESAFNAVDGPLILAGHLPDQLTERAAVPPHSSPGARPEALKEFIRASLGTRELGQIMDDIEKLLLEAAVEASGGNKQEAANLLGISRQWLYKKLQKHGSTDG